MAMPDSLPARAYLLAFDREKGRVRGTWTGALLGAAAVAELWLAGRLVDEGGRARPVPGAGRPADPVLAEVFTRLADGRPRKWEQAIKQRGIQDLVQAQLGRDWIRLDRPRRFLRPARFSVRDPRALTALSGLVRATLRGPTPVSRLPERDSMLVALLVVAEVGIAIDRQRRREFRRRIDEMIVRGGPPAHGLRQAIRHARAAASASG